MNRKKGLVCMGATAGVLAGGALAVSAVRRERAMESCRTRALGKLHAAYPLTRLPNREFKHLRIKGMPFTIEHYQARGLGHISTIEMNAGLMQMLSLVVTPTEKNLPLFSVDYIYLPGTRKAILEYYDLVAHKDREYMAWLRRFASVRDCYADLPDNEPPHGWHEELLTVTTHKQCRLDERLWQMLSDNLDMFLAMSAALPELSDEEKAEKRRITKAYTDNLVDKGGMAVNQFKAQLGAETTRRFLDTVMFGTALE